MDSLTTVRKLKDKGVEVYFEKENIWTMDSKGELLITIMSSLAQEESRSIESGRNKLTKTQYIAMRSVLDAEIIQSPEDTEMLKVLLDVLVDNPEKYSTDKREELLAKANLMTPSILAGTTSRADVSKEWMKVAGAVVGAGAILGPLGVSAGIAAVNVWLAKSVAKTKKKSKKE